MRKSAGLEAVPESDTSASPKRVRQDEDDRFREDARSLEEEEEDWIAMKEVPLLEEGVDEASERTYPERPVSRLSRYDGTAPPSRSSFSSHNNLSSARPSFEFGRAGILGSTQRWPDDPNYIDSEEGGSALDSHPGSARGGYYPTGDGSRGAVSPMSDASGSYSGHISPSHGLEVRVQTPSSDHHGVGGGGGEDSSPDQETTGSDSQQLQTWATDFRQLVDSAKREEERFAALQREEDQLPPGAAPPSFLNQDPAYNPATYQHPLAQGIQLSMGRGEFWDREVRMLGGVVRRMSTIESFGSHERELAAEGVRRGSAGTQRRESGSAGTTNGGTTNGGNGDGEVLPGVRTTSPSIMTRTSSRASRRGE